MFPYPKMQERIFMCNENRRPLVYIASPYTVGDVVINVRKSIEAAEELFDMGYLPVVPLLYHLWHFASPKDYEYWIELGLEWVNHADALLRLPGISSGADREVARARELGIPVVFSTAELTDAI